MPMTYSTIEDAQQALQTVEQDVIVDMGEETLEQAWIDILHSTASMCTPEVAEELLRRNL